MNEAEFTKACKAEGYTVMKMDHPVGIENDMHTHDFSAKLMILTGEFTVAFEDGDAVCGPGDRCDVPAGTMHAERSGPEGATILLGKK
tara:strand:- start:379 stop:642 length:264 start_codon:yes stop_codon:yes gene_type:complete